MEEGKIGESFGRETKISKEHLWDVNYWNPPFIDVHQGLGQKEGCQRLHAKTNIGVPNFKKISDGMRKKSDLSHTNKLFKELKKKISWCHPSF